MKLRDVYQEVILRAGEGYDAYEDRAINCFWKAVSNLIQTNEFSAPEIRVITQRYVRQINKDSFNNCRYNIFRIWNDLNPAQGREQSPFHTHLIFDYRMELTPIYPENMKFHQVPISELRTTQPLDKLTQAMRLPELIWSFDYHDIWIAPSSDTFQCLLTAHIYCIPITVTGDPDADTDRYFSYGFLVRAIEAAVKFLVTETE